MWIGFKGLDEHYLNKFNRTSYHDVKYVYGSDKQPIYSMQPFIWKDYLFDKNGKQVSYRSFRECFEQVLLPGGFLQAREKSNIIGMETTTEAEFDNKKEFYKRNGLFTYFAQLEIEFGCNSICEPNLFFINKEL